MTADPMPDLTKDAVLAIAPLLDGGEEELAKEIEGRLCQSPRLGSVCGSYRESDLRMVARGLTDALLPRIAARIAQARAEEREACAGLADIGMVFPLRHGVSFDNERVVAKHIAAAIRARKETTND